MLLQPLAIWALGSLEFVGCKLWLVGPHDFIALALAGEMAWVRSCRGVQVGEGLFGSASPSLLHFTAVVAFPAEVAHVC